MTTCRGISACQSGCRSVLPVVIPIPTHATCLFKAIFYSYATDDSVRDQETHRTHQTSFLTRGGVGGRDYPWTEIPTARTPLQYYINRRVPRIINHRKVCMPTIQRLCHISLYLWHKLSNLAYFLFFFELCWWFKRLGAYLGPNTQPRHDIELSL